MNQPASKEPTMDEILSSIRQIIADDDEAAARAAAAPQAAEPAALKAAAPMAEVKPMPQRPAPPPLAARPEPAAAPRPVPPPSRPQPEAAKPASVPMAARPVPAPAAIDPFADDDDDIAPLALTPDQIVERGDEAADEDASAQQAAESAFTEAEPLEALAIDLVVPDDVAFDADEDDEEPAAEPAHHGPEPVASVPDPSTAFASAAPMPDPDLSGDLAERLLEPATDAVVRDAFSRLNTTRLTPAMPVGDHGLTIEAMIREMLRPMLKDWLDENLPAMVERMVEQEIERVSRGGR